MEAECEARCRQRVPAGGTGYRLGNWDAVLVLSIIFQRRPSLNESGSGGKRYKVSLRCSPDREVRAVSPKDRWNLN